MKVILTCAFPQPGYELPHRVLEAAGLVAGARSSAEGITPTVLHDRIIGTDRVSGLESLAAVPIEQLVPDKPSHNVATDIFLGNVDAEAWGWVDSRVVYLLDFWKNFDPQIRFVLAYESPAATVGGVLQAHPVRDEEIARILGVWRDFNTELLRFYYANQERCLLVNSGAVRQSPQSFSEHVAETFGLNAFPEGDSFSAPQTRPPDALLREYLAKALVMNRDESRALYEELESAADFPLVLPQTSASHAWNDYAEVLMTHVSIVKSQSNRLEALELENSSLRERQTELEQVANALTQAKDEQASLAAEREARLAAAQSASTATATELARVKKEGELTLLQLYQAQEELEQHWLDNQKQQQELESLGRDKSALSSRCAELEQRVQALTHAQQQQAKHVDSLTNARGDLERQIQSLTQSRDEQARLATERGTALAAANAVAASHPVKLEKLQEQHHALAKENELLLLQIHQVQEELESYYIENQKLLGRSDPQAEDRAAIHELLPAEILYDLRREIDGDNWYYAEHDGRWAGPETCSTLRVPAMATGIYRLEVCVVDAMEPEILSGMVLTLNGRPLSIEVDPGNRYSKLVKADITVGESDVEFVWEFAFRFPKLVSPAEHGSDDQRRLAIRVASLCVKLQDQSAPWQHIRKPTPWWAIWKRVS